MDFCEHRVTTIIAEFDDVRAQKLKKNQTSPTSEVSWREEFGPGKVSLYESH